MFFLSKILNKKILFFFFPFTLVQASLLEDNQKIEEFSRQVISLYQLEEKEEWKEITQRILDNPTTPEASKKTIIEHHRRIILFKYPSDGLWVKGFLSFTPDPEHHPLLIIFRWGNQNFALMNPGVTIATYGDYTVLSSALRGGVSEGKDEFGGSDIDDMVNLINYIPTISKMIGITLHPHCTFMLGPSRGGLEMFLTLAKNKGLQQKIDKVATLSSILDLHEQIKDRPQDMKAMFQEQFGLTTKNEKAWIEKRDPLKAVENISPSLPILIVQGTNDPRINLEEGYNMVNKLTKTGHSVDYWEVPGRNHTLTNIPTMPASLAEWFEKNLNCHGKDPRVYLTPKETKN